MTGANLTGAIIDSKTQLDTKWRLVWEIVSEGKANQDLKDVDLAEANLVGANLSRANLAGTNLTGAGTGANLTGLI